MIIIGNVVSGHKRGREIGFPTANLNALRLDSSQTFLDSFQVDSQKPNSPELKLELGVFACRVKIDNKVYFGALHIGPNATFGENELSVEVNIFDFNQDIYGKTIQVLVQKNVRGTQKFDSVTGLIEQIKIDVANIKNFYQFENNE